MTGRSSLYTGLRLGELAALDLADTRLSARKGIVVVRAGKGDSYRPGPAERASPVGAGEHDRSAYRPLNTPEGAAAA